LLMQEQEDKQEAVQQYNEELAAKTAMANWLIKYTTA
jgi:hypothetical protein